jgi:hypothetical protein
MDKLSKVRMIYSELQLLHELRDLNLLIENSKGKKLSASISRIAAKYVDPDHECLEQLKYERKN